MKKIMIIGATSGLGRGIAETYIRRGCTVAVMGRRVHLLDDLVRRGEGRVMAAPCDVAAGDVTERVAALADRMGGMDLLVLSAGVGRQNPTLDYSIERTMLDTNVVGWTAVVDWAYRYFEHQGYGHLAAISSIAALRGLAPAPAYSATKAFQAHYLEALRERAIAQGGHICVTDIRPGFVDTPLLADPTQFFWVLPVDKAVRAIVRAIDRKRGVTTVTRRWAMLAPLMRMAPVCLLARLMGK